MDGKLKSNLEWPKFVPEVLDRVQVWRLGGCLPPMNVSCGKDFLYVIGCMLGVIVLHQLMSVGVDLGNKW